MPVLCLTIDLDRDVNIPLQGRLEAGSLDRGNGAGPRFVSTQRGLTEYSVLLDRIGMPATFFAEGRTLEKVRDSAGCLAGHEVGCHGYDHEDFSLLSVEESRACIEHGKQTIRDITGTCPRSFRAPYMSKPEYMDGLLCEAGFIADSSEYAPSEGCRPYSLIPGLSEVPVLSVTGPNGKKMTSYLWPMHEGRRNTDSYLALVDSVPEDGVLVLADHTWHIAEQRNGGMRGDDSVACTISDLGELLSALLDKGFRPSTISRLIAHAL